MLQWLLVVGELPSCTSVSISALKSAHLSALAPAHYTSRRGVRIQAKSQNGEHITAAGMVSGFMPTIKTVNDQKDGQPTHMEG